MKSSGNRIITALALAVLVSLPGQAVATPLTLDPSMFTMNGTVFDSGWVFLEENEVAHVTPNESAQIQIDFLDGAFEQKLEIFGSPSTTDTFTLFEFGLLDPADDTLFFDVSLSDLTGAFFSDAPPSVPSEQVAFDPFLFIATCTGTICGGSFSVPDLTDSSFDFHDIHFNLRNTDEDDLTIDSVRFKMQGVSPPTQTAEPATLALLGLGLTGLVAGRRRFNK